MQEKVWTRKPDGTYSVNGEIEVGSVYLSYFRDGEWSKPYAAQNRKQAEKVIEDAIASGKAKLDAYRLTSAEGAEKLLEKKRKIFAENRRKWEEPTNKRAKQESREQEEKIESEDEVMAKKVVKKAGKKAVEKETAEKVGGIFREGTALAHLYEVFEDERPHSKEKVLKDLTKEFGCKGLQGEWRIRRFREKGEELGAFALTLDSEEGTLQLKFGKGGAKKVAKKAGKEEKAPKAAKKAAAREESPKTEKATRAVASLIRRTLSQSKNGFTKNQLAEKLNEDFDIDVEDTRAAISAEIKAGGLIYEGGVLELAEAF